jgi:hypothetical protein
LDPWNRKSTVLSTIKNNERSYIMAETKPEQNEPEQPQPTTLERLKAAGLYQEPESTESKLARLRAAGITVITESPDSGGCIIAGTSPPSQELRAKKKASPPKPDDK